MKIYTHSFYSILYKVTSIWFTRGLVYVDRCDPHIQKAVCINFNFLTSSVPDDDPVGSKHVGRSCKNIKIL
jgi:hypothetical protein